MNQHFYPHFYKIGWYSNSLGSNVCLYLHSVEMDFKGGIMYFDESSSQ